MFVELGMEAARRLLGEQLLDYLNDLHPLLRTDVVEALASEGKLFHQPESQFDGRWALLPFYLARALRGGEPVCGSAAALAVECVICATDLLDDVMDEDMTPLIERAGAARVVNVALVLLALPQRILLSSVGHACSSSLAARLLDDIQRALLLAAAGQQRDLLAERRLACELSREECIDIASAKAGSLLGMACRLGAACAGEEEALIERWAEFGRVLGIAAQLDNDAHDLAHLLQATEAGSQKSDLKRGKKTLPVVLAAHSLRETRRWEAGEIEQAFQDSASLASEEQAIYFAALREGILTTWGISLLYRERARDHFDELRDSGPVWENVRRVLGFD